MKRLNTFLFSMLLALAPTFLLGQRAITGTVTDADTKEPLIGANILIQGTTIGTITDFDGNFSEFYTLNNGQNDYLN